jgi:hypothetical protein
MSEVTAVNTMLVRLEFSTESENYLTRDADIESLEEISYLDGNDDVESIIKILNHPGGSTTVGSGSNAVTAPHDGYTLSSRDEANLKLCVFT